MWDLLTKLPFYFCLFLCFRDIAFNFGGGGRFNPRFVCHSLGGIQQFIAHCLSASCAKALTLHSSGSTTHDCRTGNGGNGGHGGSTGIGDFAGGTFEVGDGAQVIGVAHFEHDPEGQRQNLGRQHALHQHQQTLDLNAQQGAIGCPLRTVDGANHEIDDGDGGRIELKHEYRYGSDDEHADGIAGD